MAASYLPPAVSPYKCPVSYINVPDKYVRASTLSTYAYDSYPSCASGAPVAIYTNAVPEYSLLGSRLSSGCRAHERIAFFGQTYNFTIRFQRSYQGGGSVTTRVLVRIPS